MQGHSNFIVADAENVSSAIQRMDMARYRCGLPCVFQLVYIVQGAAHVHAELSGSLRALSLLPHAVTHEIDAELVGLYAAMPKLGRISMLIR